MMEDEAGDITDEICDDGGITEIGDSMGKPDAVTAAGYRDPDDEEDAEEAANKTYTVNKGDTFNGVAKSHGVSPGALRSVNPDYAKRDCPTDPNLKGYDYITPGDQINIPDKEESKSDPDFNAFTYQKLKFLYGFPVCHYKLDQLLYFDFFYP